MNRWAPEKLQALRDAVAGGLNLTQAAEKLGFSYQTVKRVAKREHIRPGNVTVALNAQSKLASDQLTSEINAARSEFSTAPIYRGGWPDDI